MILHCVAQGAFFDNRRRQITDPQIGERPILQDEPFRYCKLVFDRQLSQWVTPDRHSMTIRAISRKRAVKHIELPDDGANLSDYGITQSKQSTWTSNRRYATDVAIKLNQGAEGRDWRSKAMLERHAERMRECSLFMSLRADETEAGGDFKMNVHELHTCKVRSCPFCQHAKQERRKLDFMPVVPKAMALHPKARWVFLTLTVRNPRVEDTAKTLDEMAKAWKRFVKRPEMEPAIGWVRMTEITVPMQESTTGKAEPVLTHCHPHYHILMMVPSSWFGRHYVKQSRWQEIWSECLQDPNLKDANTGQANIDIRAVKPKGEATGDISQDMHAAITETFKYAVKGSDLVLSADWTAEIAIQTNRKRNIAFGGLLKTLVRESKEDSASLTEALNAESDEGETVNAGKLAELKAGTVIIGFRWDAMQRRYVRDESRDAIGEITAQMQDDITALEAGGKDESFASVDWERPDLAEMLTGTSPEIQRIIKRRIIDDMIQRGDLLPVATTAGDKPVNERKTTTARGLIQRDIARTMSRQATKRRDTAAKERQEAISECLRLARGRK